MQHHEKMKIVNIRNKVRHAANDIAVLLNSNHTLSMEEVSVLDSRKHLLNEIDDNITKLTE